jgi:hypothetical protein
MSRHTGAHILAAATTLVLGACNGNRIGTHATSLLGPTLPRRSLDVACSSPVMRGDEIACAAREPGGQAVSVTTWAFVSSDASLPYAFSEAGSAVPWKGTMAVGGRVTATVADGRTASTMVDVRARNWTSVPVRFDVVVRESGAYGRDGRLHFGDSPNDFSELGDTQSSIVMASNLGDFFTLITAGPNTGLYYAIDIPLKVRIDVAVNKPAMMAGGTWWRMHPEGRYESGTTPHVTTWCSRTDVVNLLTPIRQHEGALQHDYSHVSTLKPPYQHDITSGVERMVQFTLPTVQDFLPLATAAEQNAPIVSASITHDARYNPVRQPPCTFRFRDPILARRGDPVAACKVKSCTGPQVAALRP